MKRSKRILALFLSVILALGLGPAVFAEGENEPDPAMPVITKQPESLTVSFPFDSDIRITIEAEIPNGDPISYLWFVNDELYYPWLHDFREPYFKCGSKGENKAKSKYHCVVYNKNKDDDSHRVVSETVTVKYDYWSIFSGLADGISGWLGQIGGSISDAAGGVSGWFNDLVSKISDALRNNPWLYAIVIPLFPLCLLIIALAPILLPLALFSNLFTWPIQIPIGVILGTLILWFMFK